MFLIFAFLNRLNSRELITMHVFHYNRIGSGRLTLKHILEYIDAAKLITNIICYRYIGRNICKNFYTVFSKCNTTDLFPIILQQIHILVLTDDIFTLTLHNKLIWMR